MTIYIYKYLYHYDESDRLYVELLNSSIKTFAMCTEMFARNERSRQY